MGLGAEGQNANSGNRGSSWRYEYQVLKALCDIATNTTVCCPTAATEATLLQVLGALLVGQEFEQALVVDLGGVGCPANCPTYIQIRIWNTVTHTFEPPVYYDAAGVLVVPVGPLQFVNPQFALDNILLQVTAINADLDVALSTRASEATLVAFAGLFTPVVRTPTYIQAVAAGTVAAGARAVSVYNSGTTAGVWLGTPIAPGVQLSFDAGGQGDTLGAFAYTASATATLEITTIV